MSNNEKIDARLQEMKAAIPKLKKENREIGTLLYRSLKENSWRSNIRTKTVLRLQAGKTSLAEVFSGSRAELLPFLFGKDKTQLALFEKLWSRLPIYSYQTGWGRRSFRSQKNTLLYLEKGVSLIADFFKTTVTGCTLKTYFEFAVRPKTANQRDQKTPVPPEAVAWDEIHGYYGCFAAHLIALALDEKDAHVKERIHEIIYSDNVAASGMLTREIVRGILMSRDADAHKMLGDLLLAAKSQEGLRQTILESCDECSVEGFEYILNLVLENNLERFSSVIRAMGIWMGLSFADARGKTIKKALEISRQINHQSEHDALASALLDSDDLIELYVALWGVGLREIANTKLPLLSLVKSGKKHKRLAALHFLGQAKNASLTKEVALSMLDEDDLETWDSLLPLLANLLNEELQARRTEERLTINVDGDGKDENDDENNEDGDDKFEKIPAIVDPTALRLDDKEVRQVFNRLHQLAESTPKKETRFEPNVYDESIRRISANNFISAMVDAVVILGRKDDDVDALIALQAKADMYTRSRLVDRIFTMKNPKHRSALIELFCDPHIYRHQLGDKFKDVNLTSAEYEVVESALRLKSADLRMDAIKLILERTPEGLQESIERLLQSKEEQKRLAGLDLISQAEKLAKTKKDYVPVVAACKTVAAEVAAVDAKKGTKKSAAEAILVEKLAAEQGESYTRENGYGLCDPNGKIDFPAPKNAKRSLRKFLLDGIEPCKKILTELSALIHKHREYEYEGYQYSWENERKHFILGTAGDIEYLTSDKEREARGNKEIILSDLPLGEIWEKFFTSKKLKPEDYLRFHFYLQNCMQDYLINNRLDFDNMYCKPTEWFKKWYLDECCPLEELKKLLKFFGNLSYRSHVATITRFFFRLEIPRMAGLLGDLLATLYNSMSEERLAERMEQKPDAWHWRYGNDAKPTPIMSASSFFDFFFESYEAAESDFEKKFKLLYKFYTATDFTVNHLDAEDFEKARELKLVDDAELYRELLCRYGREGVVSTISSAKKEDRLKYPHFNRLFPAARDRLLDIELKRGDSPTDVSGLVSSIDEIEGIDWFVRILNALGKEPFTRGYMYGEKSRKDALCSLLKKCQPRDVDKIIGKTSSLSQFSEQRLLEAAMYVPEWIDLVQQHLGWNGLTSACWYFHAHINETMSDEKESVIARYSPISPQRFKDGAFDIDWFNDAYKTLGEKRFQMVYDAAKYITSGGNHRRAQIFADALRGKLKLEELRKSVKDKRNKDNLLAYSLLPLKKGKAGEKEQLERYAFLQEFLKESKKFGQQRKESEGKICAIALENLARAAGYEDVDRFTWAMETERSKEYAKYFAPKKVEGFALSIAVDEFGKPAIRSVKEDGAELKDVPTKLKKHAYVEELKEVVKLFRDQFRSVRENFEKAMTHETEFTAEELANLSQNPVIKPIIEKLVYRCEKSFGFFSEGHLLNVDGNDGKKKLKPTDRLVIAHPAHLYEAKVWKAFQKIVFSREIVQPFKQVFRELYLPNADEKNAKTCSRRYAGHQVQPSKTVALLKNRNWTIDPDLGFQKVFYKLDVLIRLYCYADWFMPSDIEPPTIEKIEFVDRKTLEVIPLAKIPPVIFSEIMRDLDLVVSIAHVGGVDPEASLSTVEMRAAIMEETLKLLKLKNVAFKKSHVMIKGTLGEYTVHLGSGEVQQMAGGSLTILPVHSQRRGRLFLPFIDDDPKTAEIVSKTLLLAEDDKIKDPTILAAIQG